MSKKLILALAVLAVIVISIVLFSRDKESPVIVATPQEGDTVTSPLVVSGKARGPWFFEASFPVRLLDALGNEIAIAPAQAEGEWMTEEHVPFAATLTFNVPAAQYGTLVFQKDNPSGDPARDEDVRIAVWLEPGAGGTSDETTLEVFFGRSDAPAGEECETVAVVTRTVPATPAIARAALEELFKGVSAAEAAQGYTTSIPSGVVIQSLDIRDGTAYLDVNRALAEDVAGSCRVTQVRAQIEETLKQFPTVENVILSIDGQTEDVLQP